MGPLQSIMTEKAVFFVVPTPGCTSGGRLRPPATAGETSGCGARSADGGGGRVGGSGFGVGALGAVAGLVGDLDKALAVEHKARPPAVGDEPPRPVDL